MNALLAQAAAAHSFGRWAILIIIVVVVIAILLAVLRFAGVAVPAEVIRIGWIVIVAALAILAIVFLLSLL